ncbi:magnesium dechelatase SGRL, chloroplastic-like [Curcuma longa]|uniref:magnesium dechelatase SGRL, chloroplastic-like n=1 Tax=Curcuma longa TaxID=136217 RepID=UPI003D9E7558
MACYSAGNAFVVPTVCSPPSFSSSSTMGGTSRMSVVSVAPASRLVVLSCQRRDFYGPLAARLLGPPTKFEASKLKVVFTGEEMEKHAPSTIHRAYTLTHCDFTANLTLSVSNNIHIKMLLDWQTRLHKDDVVAEWKKVNEEISLHVHCFVSGTSLLQDLAAEFRYHIFSKELPLVLKAVVHGDSTLFSKHPELMEAEVWVYFHSKSKKYNRLECWGALKDAAQRTLDDGFDTFQASVFDSLVKFGSPKTILHALVAFLL